MSRGPHAHPPLVTPLRLSSPGENAIDHRQPALPRVGLRAHGYAEHILLQVSTDLTPPGPNNQGSRNEGTERQGDSRGSKASARMPRASVRRARQQHADPPTTGSTILIPRPPEGTGRCPNLPREVDPCPLTGARNRPGTLSAHLPDRRETRQLVDRHLLDHCCCDLDDLIGGGECVLDVRRAGYLSLW